MKEKMWHTRLEEPGSNSYGFGVRFPLSKSSLTVHYSGCLLQWQCMSFKGKMWQWKKNEWKKPLLKEFSNTFLRFTELMTASVLLGNWTQWPQKRNSSKTWGSGCWPVAEQIWSSRPYLCWGPMELTAWVNRYKEL